MSTEESRAAVERWLELAGRREITDAMAPSSDNALWGNIGSTPVSVELVGVQGMTGTVLVDAVLRSG